MMSLIKDIARRPVRDFATARGVHHHQRVIGNDDIGSSRGARGTFDEAFAVVWASGIDTLAAPVGQRGRATAPKQRREPAGQIAAHHIAIGGIARPACDKLRQYRRAPRKAALQRVLQIEQAGVILSPFARHHFRAADGGIREQALRLLRQLALQRFGEG